MKAVFKYKMKMIFKFLIILCGIVIKIRRKVQVL